MFFSRLNGPGKPLDVSLVPESGIDVAGGTVDTVATIPAADAWTPSGQTALATLLAIPAGGSAQAHLHFQSAVGAGRWQIDDVLVDPYRVA